MNAAVRKCQRPELSFTKDQRNNDEKQRRLVSGNLSAKQASHYRSSQLTMFQGGEVQGCAVLIKKNNLLLWCGSFPGISE